MSFTYSPIELRKGKKFYQDFNSLAEMIRKQAEISNCLSTSLEFQIKTLFRTEPLNSKPQLQIFVHTPKKKVNHVSLFSKPLKTENNKNLNHFRPSKLNIVKNTTGFEYKYEEPPVLPSLTHRNIKKNSLQFVKSVEILKTVLPSHHKTKRVSINDLSNLYSNK